ncbi:transferrin-like [Ostrinia nubilalis]|uniref:transferrin-like n=1 Tax=Ostrinia nubilalis TaxID=29057 RepID=UPI0030826B9A
MQKVAVILFLFSFINNALLQGTGSGTNGNLRLCVVEGRGSYKRTLKNCPVLDKESSGVECVLGTDRLDCLRRINKGTVDFGAFSPEDLIAAQWAGVDVLVTNELRYRSKPFERSVVAVVNRRILSDEPMPVRALLKNRTLCHPGSGVDDLRPLSFTLSAYLEFQVLSRDCLDDLSLAENRVKALADFFGSSCKAGAWVVDKNRDAQLKRKYSSLCAACGSSSCSANDPYWGSSGALACLAEVGDVAWGELVDVQAYFGLSEPRGKSLRPPAEKYAYLCRDGSHQPLETPEPCVWLQRPWPVIVAKRGKSLRPPAEKYAYLCRDGSHQPLETPEPCVWLQRPWPVIVAKRGKSLRPPAEKYAYLCRDGSHQPLETPEPCVWLQRPWPVIVAKSRWKRRSLACGCSGRGPSSWPRGPHLTKSLRPPAEKYAYLCRDGSHQPLETPEPCVWLQRPWPVIVAKSRASEAVANLALSLHNNNVTVDPHWRGALAALLEIRSAQPEPLQPPVTPADYLAKARGFREAYSQTGCVPPRHITFCTTSNLERNKCEWLSEAGAVYGVAPSIQCAIANSTSECMKAVANGDAHIVAADSNWLMKAERDYNLTAVLHEATPIVDKTHTVVANVLTDSHINKMADLRGKRVAFPEYDGVAWHSVLRYLKNKEELSCGDFKGYFKEICAPGVSQSVIEQAKVFTTTCYEEGLSGEMQALKALVEGKTDVAFISMETYKTYRAKLISQPWASEPLQLNPVCPEDNPKYCFISWANIGHIYASKNISTMRHQEIVNVFTKLDQLFGKQYPFHNSIFSMYGPFNHQPDVLFHNSTKNLITDDSLKSQPYSRIPLNFERSLSNSTDSCQAEEIANLSAKIQPGLLVMMVSLVVYLIS